MTPACLVYYSLLSCGERCSCANLVRISLAVVCASGPAVLGGGATAGRQAGGRPPKDKAKDYSNAPIVVNMMAFDKKKDGKLTSDEITDERLLRLFDQADVEQGRRRHQGRTDGAGGQVGRRRRSRRPARPAPAASAALAVPAATAAPVIAALAVPAATAAPVIAALAVPAATAVPTALAVPAAPAARRPVPARSCRSSLQTALKLTDDQKKQLDELQKDVDAKLDKILTDDQKTAAQGNAPRRGPGGPGGPGGDRGPGGAPGDRVPDRPNPDK